MVAPLAVGLLQDLATANFSVLSHTIWWLMATGIANLPPLSAPHCTAGAVLRALMPLAELQFPLLVVFDLRVWSYQC